MIYQKRVNANPIKNLINHEMKLKKSRGPIRGELVLFGIKFPIIEHHFYITKAIKKIS